MLFRSYRVVSDSITWLTRPLQYTDLTIYVSDASRLVDIITQHETAPAAVDGVISVGINADKNSITKIIAYNNTTAQLVQFEQVIVDLALTLEFTSGVSEGDSLTITITQGNLLYINGEQIRFGTIDLDNNTVTDLQRGVNGTGTPAVSDKYTYVIGIHQPDRLPEAYYNQTWNSYNYNPTLGDPLQISDTFSANFLNEVVS